MESKVIVESRDVEFFETKFCSDLTDGNIRPNSSDINSSSSLNKRSTTDIPNEPRKSQRIRKEKNISPDFISSQAIVFLIEGDTRKYLYY